MDIENIKLVPNLKVYIAKKGLTQKKIAGMLNVTSQMVSFWVTGKNKPPLETAYKLAIILDCTVDDLWTVVKTTTKNSPSL